MVWDNGSGKKQGHAETIDFAHSIPSLILGCFPRSPGFKVSPSALLGVVNIEDISPSPAQNEGRGGLRR